jgi:predicted amidophosphoribosyltransferase
MRSRVVAELLALLAPPGCAACRTPLDDARELVCPRCRRELPWLRGERCERCGLPPPCTPCPAARAAFDHAWAPLAYAGPARGLVTALKFDGALPIADLMAAQITAAAPQGLLTSPGPTPSVPVPPPGTGWPGAAVREIALVPTPAHPARVRARGFDQSDRLAAALARRTGLLVDPCLRRAGSARPQLGRSRRARLRRGGIDIAAAGPVPAHPVLVDDVHTTGATLNAAAQALKDAGAHRVTAVTYARTTRV